MRTQKKIGKIAAWMLASALFTAAFAGNCFAGSWKEELGKWWYDLGDGTRATGWQWIDSDGDGKAESYFFDAEGNLLTGTMTPDGFEVDENGAWIKNGKIQTSAADVISQFFKAPPLPSGDEAAQESEAAREIEAEQETEAEQGTEAAQETETARETEAAQETAAAETQAFGTEDQDAGPGTVGTDTAAAEEQDGQGGIGRTIVETARAYVGKLPYVYGGTSLLTGADCAGFTQSIFALFGFSLPRETGAQLSAGIRISKDQLQPGDLVFWQNGSGRVYHVGIYSGPDSFIHASNTARGWVFEDHLHDMPEPCGYARY